MQAHDHGAEFADACRTIVWIAGESALRCSEVPGIVAPVEAVGRTHRADRRLLRIGIGRGLRDRRRDAIALRRAREIEDGQQVHVGHAGARQCAQMAHAGAFVLCEGEVFAAMPRRHGGVADREVAHVQFVDRHVFLRADGVRRARMAPALRHQPGRVEVGDVAASRIRVEAERVGVGDEVAHHADAAHEDFDGIAVMAAMVFAANIRRPDAGRGIQAHRMFTASAVPAMPAARRIQAQRHLARGRRPQPEARAAACDAHAEIVDGLRGGIAFVEEARRLRRGRREHATRGVFLHQQQLMGHQRIQSRHVRRFDRQPHARLQPAEPFGDRIGHIAADAQRQCAIRTVHRFATRGDDPAIRRVIQLERARAIRARPLQAIAAQPERAGIRGRDAAQVGRRGEDLRRALDQPDVADAIGDGQCREGDADVVIPAILVVHAAVRFRGHAVHDELDRTPRRVVARVQHGQIEGDLVHADGMVRHRRQRHGCVPLVQRQSVESRDIDAAGRPQVQAPLIVGIVEPTVVHAHGRDVGRRGDRIGAIHRGVAGTQPHFAAIGERPQAIDAGIAALSRRMHDETESRRRGMRERRRADVEVGAVAVDAAAHERRVPRHTGIVRNVLAGGIDLPHVQPPVAIRAILTTVMHAHVARCAIARLGGHRQQHLADIGGVADAGLRVRARCRRDERRRIAGHGGGAHRERQLASGQDECHQQRHQERQRQRTAVAVSGRAHPGLQGVSRRVSHRFGRPRLRCCSAARRAESVAHCAFNGSRCTLRDADPRHKARGGR